MKHYLLTHIPKNSRKIQHAPGGELPPAHGSGGKVKPRIEIEDDGLPTGQFLHQQPPSLLILFQGALGDARLRVDEEEDLEADAADAGARGGAHGIEEVADAVEVERIGEEQRVVRVEEVLCLVVDLSVQREEFTGCAVVVGPARTHGEGAVAASCCEAVPAVIDHDQGAVDVFIGGVEGELVDLETEFGWESEQIGCFDGLFCFWCCCCCFDDMRHHQDRKSVV